MVDPMQIVEITQGSGPLVLGLPHTGTFVPPAIWDRLNATGQALTDTDWHVHQLYRDILPGVTTVRATHHRYVIDANRDPSGESLYPGQATTDLVPLTDFDGTPIWNDPPTAQEISDRADAFHRPYHAALETELARVQAIHGAALLFDCHSIRSVVPRLFEGTLPDLNLGTYNGASCAPRLAEIALTACADAPFTHVVNGRFKGGWTTRHHGRPTKGRHAIQMELAQSTYLKSQAPPWAFDPWKADRLRDSLAPMLQALSQAVREI